MRSMFVMAESALPARPPTLPNMSPGSSAVISPSGGIGSEATPLVISIILSPRRPLVAILTMESRFTRPASVRTTLSET